MTAAKRTAPISSHPAFKWGVGAWFALLLGLGLFVMPAAVHQLLAERLGLAGLLPDATSARLALSLGAAILGLAIGLALAMRVAAINDASLEVDDDEADETDKRHGVWLGDASDDTPPARPEPDAPRRPFNPREDLAEEGIGYFETGPQADPGAGEAQAEDPVLAEVEYLPEDPYFAEEWEEPLPDPESADAWDEPAEPLADAAYTAVEDMAEEMDDSIDPHVEPVDIGTADEGASESPVAGAPPAALGDLSLEALTERLGSALVAFKAGPPETEQADPVIAFLRREAEREGPEQVAGDGTGDPQADLRSALDKLSRVGKPK